MSKKTIDINLDLFNIGKSSKTKKNREKKTLIPAIISPNILKNKLLKRIKEYKNKETESFGKNNTINAGSDSYSSREMSHDYSNSLNNASSNFKPSLVDNNYNDDISENVDLDKYTNEFNDSINYLQGLTSQKKLNDEKAIYEKNRQKKMEELQKKTLKNYNNVSSTPLVNLELPDSLKEMPLTNIGVSQKNDNSPPWGVLKGGSKPTYRLWNKTHRNVQNASYTGALSINNINSPIKNTEMMERERKMAALKDKIKQKQQIHSDIRPQLDTKSDTKPVIVLPSPTLIQSPIQESVISQDMPKIHDLVTSTPIIQTSNIQSLTNTTREKQQEQNQEITNKPVAFKRILKRTIRRKYTLGKSKIKRSVAVLLKDNKTKKKILTAYKELKREPINNVKKKLREHNLIKIGSSAPNDVVRQIYESSMLSGEINNINSDILLHNLTKDDSL
jgi:hypothetical protein